MIKIPGLFEAIIDILIGIVFLIGTIKQWPWLVNPPPPSWYSKFSFRLWFINSLSKTQRMYFNYILGIFAISLGLSGIWMAIHNWFMN